MPSGLVRLQYNKYIYNITLPFTIVSLRPNHWPLSILLSDTISGCLCYQFNSEKNVITVIEWEVGTWKCTSFLWYSNQLFSFSHMRKHLSVGRMGEHRKNDGESSRGMGRSDGCSFLCSHPGNPSFWEIGFVAQSRLLTTLRKPGRLLRHGICDQFLPSQKSLMDSIEFVEIFPLSEWLTF